MKSGNTVLVVGSGGREHALIWKLVQSPHVSKIFCAPGNGGTALLAENIPIKATDIDGLLAFAKEKKVALTIVGPEDPLINGIVDRFQAAGLNIFGPTQSASYLEGSKVFANDVMRVKEVPSPLYRSTSSPREVPEIIKAMGIPIVVKANGAALGKGVFPCTTEEEVTAAIKALMYDRVCGTAGEIVVFEEFLKGPECSVHALCSGTDFLMLPVSQDHKQIGQLVKPGIGDGDFGPNTGGMGAYSPVPGVNDEFMQFVGDQIVQPTLIGMDDRGFPFHGLLYPGLMTTTNGPKVLEFNARFGDPETQPLMMKVGLGTDLFELLMAVVDGTIGDMTLDLNPGYSVCVVIASGGYPGSYEKGKLITGLDAVAAMDGVIVFHAGTKMEDGKLYTSGGRVLGVTALGSTLQIAIQRAYEVVQMIRFEGMYYRIDIGQKGL